MRFLTADQNIRHQQNLKGRRIAIVALRRGIWELVRPHLSEIRAAVEAARPGTITEIPISEA